MNWIIFIVAGLCEVGCLLGNKRFVIIRQKNGTPMKPV